MMSATNRLHCLSFLICLVTAALALVTSGCLWGTVLDSQTNSPLVGANVSYVDSYGHTGAATTNSWGLYSFDSAAGQTPALGPVTFNVSAPGYDPLSAPRLVQYNDNPNASLANLSSFWEVQGFGLTPSGTPSPPCTLLKSLFGQTLTPGASFSLNAAIKWQLCNDGGAAGSMEKYLFRTTNGGAAWTLISRTTLGNPTPQAGVGDLPNANGVVQILFLDTTHGWMGLNSPGVNLYRSQDGGVTWAPVAITSPGVPVTSISFSDAMHGTVVTPEGTWATSDGGVTWAP